jgi:hypothetical protein
MWDVRIGAGKFLVETEGTNGGYATLSSPVTVNDGVPHKVSIARVNGTLTLTIDGKAVISGASTAIYGNLPPLQIGTDPCDNLDGTLPFTGTLSDVCVSSP